MVEPHTMASGPRMSPDTDVVPELLDDGCAFNEGPVWFADLRCLVWSDIPADRLMRWTPDAGVSVFREPAHRPNGNTRDRQGRLVTCEHIDAPGHPNRARRHAGR